MKYTITYKKYIHYEIDAETLDAAIARADEINDNAGIDCDLFCAADETGDDIFYEF